MCAQKQNNFKDARNKSFHCRTRMKKKKHFSHTRTSTKVPPRHYHVLTLFFYGRERLTNVKRGKRGRKTYIIYTYDCNKYYILFRARFPFRFICATVQAYFSPCTLGSVINTFFSVNIHGLIYIIHGLRYMWYILTDVKGGERRLRFY